MSKKLLRIIIIVVAIIIVILICLAIPKIISKLNEPEEGFTGDYGYARDFTKDSVKDITTIEGIPAEIKNKIPDLEELYYNIKKYMAENGMVDSETLTMEEYEEEGSTLKMRFKLSNKNKTKMIVELNLANNQTKINHYK